MVAPPLVQAPVQVQAQVQQVQQVCWRREHMAAK